MTQNQKDRSAAAGHSDSWQLMNFEIITCETPCPIPLVVHVPHSSTIIPAEIRPTFCLDDHELQRELLRMTDWYTDRLFDPVLELGGTLFVNRVSRLVVDPERFPDDSQEVMAAKGMGAVYIHTAAGRALRTQMSQEERTHLLEAYFHPYAQAFAELVSRMLDRHGRCVILDGHSFPSVPLPYELDQRTERPHICLGTDDVHTPESLAGAMRDLCAAEGLHVEHNRPFAGTYVPLRYWHTDPRVRSVMMELRRDLYMDEQTGAETPGLHRIRELVLRVIRTMGKA